MKEDRPEGHDVVISKGECPKCGSSKGFVTYADGHAHCYGAGCGYFVPPTGQAPMKPSSSGFSSGGPSTELPSPLSSSPPTLRSRGLSADTLRKYGVNEYGYGGGAAIGFPYYDQGGEKVALKMRYPDKARGMPVAKTSGYETLEACQLFGRPVYGDRFDRQVVITEGEYDAMSVAQAVDFKLACVSVNTGAAGAAKCLKANYLWLDRFAEIILWFDDDDPGRLASEECAKLFKVGKVRIAKAAGAKDASDLLQSNKPGDIKSAVYMAQAWRPRGIVNARDLGAALNAPETQALSYSYPPSMARLEEMTGGMHMGEVVYHVAGTGVGKSAVIREMISHLMEQGAKVAYFAFEDTLREAMLGIMSVKASERLHLLPVPAPGDVEGRKAYDAKMARWHTEVFDSGLLELFDPETAEWTLEALMSYVYYAVRALGASVVVIEPLSFMASGMDLKDDERRVLDKLAAEIAKVSKELGVHFIISHHLRRTSGVPHEEGAPTSLNEIRSSGGLANYAMGVVGWERNQQAEGDGFRVVQGRIIKPFRRTGRSGLADVLYYTDAGRIIPSPIPFPPIGKPDGKSEGGGFSPVGAGDY